MLLQPRRSVRRARHPRAMWLVHVICSGPDCEEELEVVAETIDELDRLNCDCGYGFAVLSVAEASPVELEVGEVVPFARRHAGQDAEREAA
jgi:hypothetical protein